MTAIAIQMIARASSCAPAPVPSAIPDNGMPSAIDQMASDMFRGWRAGRIGYCWAEASRLSTRASISRPTRSMNDSTNRVSVLRTKFAVGFGGSPDFLR
jgi:hypothetical protein